MSEVDVIILSLNRLNDTMAAIDSALAQRGVEKRVLVFDQGSAPDVVAALEEKARQSPEVVLELSPTNLGVAGGRNRLMEMGDAPYVVCLDNDAEFDGPDVLLRVKQRFEANPKLGAIGFKILNFFSRDLDLRNWGYPKALLDKQDEEFMSTRFVGAGHALRRSAFDEVGRYDHSLFFTWEETDLSFRLINAGYRIIYMPDLAVLHKVSAEERVDWGRNRYYYFVRNRLYLTSKYHGSSAEYATRAVGYLVKGLYNGHAGQAIRAVRDALGMARELERAGARDSFRLNEAAREYLAEHEYRVRGSLFERLRREVFTKLPNYAAQK